MDNEMLEKIAKESEASGEVNLAIVLYAYLGSKKAGLDGMYAEHCQDFARSGLDMIKQLKLKRN